MKSLNKKSIVIAIAVATFIFFVFVVYRLLFVVNEPFPDLAEGKYVGYFSGDLFEAGVGDVFFSVESRKSNANLDVVIYKSGWGLKTAQFQASGENSQEPLIVTGSDAVLRFSGAFIQPGLASGKVVNLSSGKEAGWKLSLLEAKNSKQVSNKAYSQILSMRAEQDNLELQLGFLEKSIEPLAAEEIRITQALSDGSTLREKAQSRFSEKQSEIDTLKNQIVAEEKKLLEMKEALDIARSVTQRGRLTGMARESMDREFRAINYKLSTEARQNDANLLANLAKAEEALALKNELTSMQQQAISNREMLN